VDTAAPAAAADEAPTAPEQFSPGMRQALEVVDNLAFGTWFTFCPGEDATPVRLKLSWFSQLSGNYMFVDSMGIKAAVKERIELASLLADGQARILSDEQQTFVQRAMLAVRRILTGEIKTGTR
jgi:hypothetical protein